jgi:hypothetical protein
MLCVTEFLVDYLCIVVGTPEKPSGCGQFIPHAGCRIYSASVVFHLVTEDSDYREKGLCTVYCNAAFTFLRSL